MQTRNGIRSIAILLGIFCLTLNPTCKCQDFGLGANSYFVRNNDGVSNSVSSETYSFTNRHSTAAGAIFASDSNGKTDIDGFTATLARRKNGALAGTFTSADGKIGGLRTRGFSTTRKDGSATAAASLRAKNVHNGSFFTASIARVGSDQSGRRLKTVYKMA